MSSTAKRVLITRAARQGLELADRLRVAGLEPVLIPAIETVALTSYAALDAALLRLGDFHWLLFTSANAVEALAGRLGEQPFRGQSKVAAIGPATARALDMLGRFPDLIPAQAVAESLSDALLPYARQPDGSPTRFLLIRAEDARDRLPADLRAAGAAVTVAPAYRTVIPDGSEELVRALFGASKIDPSNAASSRPVSPVEAVTFTSSSTARNLIALCGTAGVSLPDSAKRVSIGPITTQTLKELGLPPHAVAPEATVASLAQTVIRILRA